MKNKVLSALLSLAIAFGLWLYVVTVVSPGSEQTYYNIPVTLQNENILTDRGLMITSEIPTVTLKLAGNRTDLNSLNENNINILVNVAGVEAPGTHKLSYDVSFPGHIPNNAVTTHGKQPELIDLKVEKRVTKQVPVVLEYIGAAPEGFLADKQNAELDTTAIEVSGPQSVMTQITQARISIDLTNQEQTITGQFVYDLCNENGEPVDVALVKTNVEAVNLTVRIQRIKEVALRLHIIEGGGATLGTSSIVLNPTTIRVSGSDALLENLEAIELGTINLGEMLSDETKTFPILLPEGVTNVTGVTEATVDVKFPNLRVKSFHVSQIRAVNVPDGMEAEIITQTLEVTVRGPVALIDVMKDSDIVVTVDFTDAQTGTETMRPTITVSSQYADVGAVGTYSVTATLREKAAKAQE